MVIFEIRQGPNNPSNYIRTFHDEQPFTTKIFFKITLKKNVRNETERTLRSLDLTSKSAYSSLGSASIEITETKMVSTVWTGSQRSLAFS
jgi:hypothetical protein